MLRSFLSYSLLTPSIAIMHSEVPRQASISLTGMKSFLPGIFRLISPTMRNLWLDGLPHQVANTESGPPPERLPLNQEILSAHVAVVAGRSARDAPSWADTTPTKAARSWHRDEENG